MNDSKVILITGSSQGMGFDAAKTLAQKGHHVFASMRGSTGKNEDRAAELNKFAEAESVKLSVIELDVTKDSDVSAAFEKIIADTSRIDVVINNAGYGMMGPSETLTTDEFKHQIDVNLFGAFRVTNAAIPHMRKQKSGLIIQVTTVGARTAFPGMSAYHASKWGLEGYAESIRYELAPLGIAVAIVEPGPIGTNLYNATTMGSNAEAGAAYAHVGGFMESFMTSFQEMLSNPELPTDASVVTDTFIQLINTPLAEVPLRTISGIDLGIQAVNDATEPLRQQRLEGMGITAFDKAAAPE